jgi:two-component system, chemotaxis family, chemotaxis protein CheY
MNMYDQEILDEFVVEANELLGSAEEDILEMEDKSGHSDNETVNRIFRAFHTVKGNAAMIGLETLSFLAHHAEDTLTKVRSGSLLPDKTMVDVLLKVIDVLKALLQNAKSGINSDLDVSGLITQLDQLDQESLQTTNSTVDKHESVSPPESSVVAEFTPKPTRKIGNLKILVAEDDYTSRKVIRLMLAGYGQVDAVVNGEEAVDAIKASYEKDSDQSYDLICMDIMMPEMDGMEAVKLIRTYERELKIPLTEESAIIMTTALDDPKTVIRSLYKSGATAYLVKPVQKEGLEKEMRKLGLLK